MPVVDTSFLVALFNADDTHHPAASKIAADAVSLIVAAPVLVEFLQVVHYGVRKAKGERAAHRAARTALRDLTRLPSVTIETDYGVRETQVAFLSHPNLSYVDAAAIQCARRRSEELATFDEEQRAALAPKPSGKVSASKGTKTRRQNKSS